MGAYTDRSLVAPLLPRACVNPGHRARLLSETSVSAEFLLKPSRGSEPLNHETDGRLEVFGIGSDSDLWNIWQSVPHAGPWSGWNKLT